MDTIKMLGLSALVILFTASMVAGGAPRMIVAEQAIGDAVVEALDGTRSPASSAFTPAVVEAAQTPAVSPRHAQLEEQQRLAPYVALHRGKIAPPPAQLPTGEL